LRRPATSTLAPCTTCAAFSPTTSPRQSRAHRRFEARRLQRPAVRHTVDDIRQTAARLQQPDQSRLPLPGSHRHQVAAPVAPLASSEAADHLQGGSTDSQGSGHSHSGVSQRPGTDQQTHIPTRAPRSSDVPLLVVPRTQTELARCAFSVAATSIWNSLPADIRLCESVSTFKRHLKIYLFRLT